MGGPRSIGGRGRHPGRRRRAAALAGLVLGAVVIAAPSAGARTAAGGGSTAWPGAAPPGTAVRVQRRGGLDDLAGTLITMDDRGVRLETERLGERLVTWDRIRGVAGAEPRTYADWLADGTAVWRARIRIGRGDPLTAEPLLESVADRFAGRTNEMALIVAEGLLRCRIARGANDRAIGPMLQAIRLRAAGVRTSAYAALPPVIDEETGLVPAVPPAWHAAADRTALQERLERMREDLNALATGASLEERRRAATRAAAIATCYLAAVRAERGQDPAPLPDPGDDPGLRLLVACVGGPDALAAFDAPEPADDAVDPASILEPADPRDDRPAWVRDWSGFFAGLRRLGSPDPVEQDRGLVALLRLPALHAVERPYLAGVALARAAAFLDRTGRDAEAAILRADLAARFRGHPDVPAGDPGDPESLDP